MSERCLRGAEELNICICGKHTGVVACYEEKLTPPSPTAVRLDGDR